MVTGMEGGGVIWGMRGLFKNKKIKQQKKNSNFLILQK